MKTQILILLSIISLNSLIASENLRADIHAQNILRLAVIYNLVENTPNIPNYQTTKHTRVKEKKLSRNLLLKQNNFKDKSFKKF
ncbi:hypothetical protein M1446_01375 [Candidatus Dependentiae bacterium]|nr:hypothetical protein [Candidatus Dependentiae bacterium]